jgi:DNA-binding FadR family transcriptional regulator
MAAIQSQDGAAAYKAMQKHLQNVINIFSRKV